MKSFLYTIEQGKLVLLDPMDKLKLNQFVNRMLENGITTVNITIEPVVQKKLMSSNQRKLFFVLVDMISRETGQDKDSIKEHFYKENPYDVKSVGGEIDTQTFKEFIEYCVAVSQDFFGIQVEFKNDKLNIC